MIGTTKIKHHHVKWNKKKLPRDLSDNYRISSLQDVSEVRDQRAHLHAYFQYTAK